MIRTAAIVIASLSLTGCAFDNASGWGRHNPPPNPAAGQTQVVVARQAKEARCKNGVEQRPGTSGTEARDYKCKEKFA